MVSRSQRRSLCRLWLGMMALMLSQSARADEPIQIEPLERWSSVFADSETRWTYRFSSNDALTGRASWRLTLGQRSVANGEFPLEDNAKKVVDRLIPLKWPNIKPGVIQAAQLTVTVGQISQTRQVWIFSRDPFADRHEWLKGLKLRVFDPVGDTIERFKDKEIPYERIWSRNDMDDVKDGIVIVGEGVSFNSSQDLMDDLRKLATRGIPVLCLALAEGNFEFPGRAASLSAVQLRRAEVIAELDKRLDTKWWPKGESQKSGLQISSVHDEVMAEIRNDKTAWPWCEWQFESQRKQPTRLICCGFGLIAAWDDGPTPRYLFARILERLTEKPSHLEPGTLQTQEITK